jgi:hypothetical protein
MTWDGTAPPNRDGASFSESIAAATGLSMQAGDAALAGSQPMHDHLMRHCASRTDCGLKFCGTCWNQSQALLLHADQQRCLPSAACLRSHRSAIPPSSAAWLASGAISVCSDSAMGGGRTQWAWLARGCCIAWQTGRDRLDQHNLLLSHSTLLPAPPSRPSSCLRLLELRCRGHNSPSYLPSIQLAGNQQYDHRSAQRPSSSSNTVSLARVSAVL